MQRPFGRRRRGGARCCTPGCSRRSWVSCSGSPSAGSGAGRSSGWRTAATRGGASAAAAAGRGRAPVTVTAVSATEALRGQSEVADPREAARPRREDRRHSSRPVRAAPRTDATRARVGCRSRAVCTRSLSAARPAASLRLEVVGEERRADRCEGAGRRRGSGESARPSGQGPTGRGVARRAWLQRWEPWRPPCGER